MWPLPAFLFISFPTKLLFSESLSVPHKSHIMQFMQSCGNKAHAISKQVCSNAPDCQICMTQNDSGGFKTVHKPVGSNSLSVTLT